MRRLLSRLCWGHLAALILPLGICVGFCLPGIGQEIPAEQVPVLPAGQWLTVEATAYCPCDKCTDGDRITANGTKTTRVPYALAADQSLPMGSRVYVPPGLGYLDRARPLDRIFTVDDRGGALDTEALRSGVFRIDLRFKDHGDAQKFGRKIVAVYLFTPSAN